MLLTIPNAQDSASPLPVENNLAPQISSPKEEKLGKR